MVGLGGLFTASMSRCLSCCRPTNPNKDVALVSSRSGRGTPALLAIGSHPTSQTVTGIGKTLQLPVSEHGEGMRAASPGHRRHGLGDQNLASLAQGAQILRCLDNRVAEVVVVLDGGLATAHRHPKAERARLERSVVLLDGLLHGHRSGDRCGRATEDGHEAVAEVLHLRALGGRQRLAQQREVVPGGACRRLPGRGARTAPSTRPCR